MHTPWMPLSPAQHPWLLTSGLQRIFAAVKNAGGEVRYVGGCVRDAVMGLPVADIDLACTLPPEQTDAAIRAAGLKTAPTGIAHGTITAIAGHKGYEITTLRRDIETDGRRAKVAFTDDWQADAARRDFTMNALYAAADGTVHDYVGGADDIAARRVRFIGNAEDRIREDVLRILRFFRFHARFGEGPADAEGLAACAALAPGMKQLSAERVWREISRLLAAANPAPAWRLMIDHGILPHVLPEAAHSARLEKLVAAERKTGAQGLALTRLAALLPPEAAAPVAQKLKMSNRDTELLKTLAKLPAKLHGRLDPLPFRQALYRHGAEACREAALLLAADEPADIDPALALAAEWQKPVLPVHGEDLLKLGLKPGPEIGALLRKLEDWWQSRDFRPTRDECLAEAGRLGGIT
ncbi:MAG: CCA tRNA nucleotidyltransferase [Bdellovibrionales bacterium]